MTFLERMAETLRIENEKLKKSNEKSKKLWEKLQKKEKDLDIKMFGGTPIIWVNFLAFF